MPTTSDEAIYISFVGLIVSGISLVASVCAVIVNIRRARTMDAQFQLSARQLSDQQEARSLQQMYQEINQLLNIWDHVETVLSLEGQPFESWKDKEKEFRSAMIICSRFHLVGILVIKEMVPEELIAQAWFYSIPKCYDILKPCLDHYRKTRDHRYWKAFDVLAFKVKEYAKTFEGFGSRMTLSHGVAKATSQDQSIEIG